MFIYAITIFVSAFLLFLVQPIIAKQILPWFGGSAAVWTTCMVFFQCVLFAGYAYADWSSRKLASKKQVIVHVLLLAISLASLPIIAGVGWKPMGNDDPSWRILGLLAVTIGLPYFLLSTTGPLVQSWFARGYPRATVYRLYALSNLASLLALLAYPFLIEPWIATLTQAWVWSVGYLLFAATCAASGFLSLRHAVVAPETEAVLASQEKTPPPARREQFTWLLLSAMGAFMLLAVTNHITHDLASVPFLWILPLSLYLFTFILCFEGRNWYQRKWFVAPLVLLLAAMAWTALEVELKAGIPISLAGLFVICMFFHGELAARKPAPEHLTRFYLMMSLGGALGGLAVGLVAVKVFNANYEFGLGLALTLIIAAVMVRSLRLAIPVVIIVAGGFGGYYAYANRDYFATQQTLLMKRNFYGALSVRDYYRDDPQHAVRRFVHGVIMHGEQFQAPERLDEATAYFRQGSGIGRTMTALNQPNRRIGIIGLGAGTLATYGRKGDTIRFYEINPDVIEVAHSHFSFLSRSRANIELVLGDARLAMEREAPQAYDLIVIDAFSGDSIPVHLATDEALAVYLRHLKPGGVIAFHISNKFLRLAPVLQRLADHRGLDGMSVSEPANLRDHYSSDWFLMTTDPRLRNHPAIASQIEAVEEIPGLGLWTDDFNNLFQILK